jgi:hypothetical protein
MSCLLESSLEVPERLTGPAKKHELVSQGETSSQPKFVAVTSGLTAAVRLQGWVRNRKPYP